MFDFIPNLMNLISQSSSPSAPSLIRALLPFHRRNDHTKQSSCDVALEASSRQGQPHASAETESFLVVADASTELKFFSFDCDRLAHVLTFPAPIASVCYSFMSYLFLYR
jgi:hypothetical protein